MYDLDRLLPTKWFLRVREAAGEGKGEQRERGAALEGARALNGRMLGLRPIRVAEALERDLEGCREAREALQLESGRTVAVRNIPADCQVEDVDRLFEGLGTRSASTQVLAGGGGTWWLSRFPKLVPLCVRCVRAHAWGRSYTRFFDDGCV